ncbi:polyhydroxyalkanoate depolymerase [Phenylobacterium sp.]|jgi:polyhydroxyalkanoate depolymerase|uniref:polyhydroxyalkanoate depolymerase n=1 Tax=Phenylobacterium sp. TaxID=1871053 RepID=UPI002F4198CB
MRYKAFQAQVDMMAPARLAAGAANAALGLGPPWMRQLPPLAHLSAAWEMLSRAALTHHRPDYGFTEVMIRGEAVPVREEVVAGTPFGDLVRFRKAGDPEQPRVLLVAPLSGHFATLLRGTIQTLLPDNDVYITDWRNARDAPLAAGAFGFDEYVAHVISFLETMGPGSHLIGVCQPCAHALAAVSLMAEDDNPATPLSMTLMAGPVDTRINPTTVNALATSRPIEWFEKELIDTVPARFAGAGRRVYPGFIQLTAFLLMNLNRHVDAHVDMYTHLAAGRMAEADTAKAFYDEYFAVLDLTAEFYLETVSRVFQEHLLPKGQLVWRNRRVDPAAIRRTSLFTVEGERDDICSVGQTVAAHDLCKNIFANRKRHHLQPGVGHYGVFSGRKWSTQIYPQVRNMILATN